MSRRGAFWSLVTVALIGCPREDEPPPIASVVTPAAPLPPSEPESAFELTRAMVPMRDGVSLETVIIAPRASPKALPILLMRTPYGVPADTRRMLGEFRSSIATRKRSFRTSSRPGRRTS